MLLIFKLLCKLHRVSARRSSARVLCRLLLSVMRPPVEIPLDVVVLLWHLLALPLVMMAASLHLSLEAPRTNHNRRRSPKPSLEAE